MSHLTEDEKAKSNYKRVRPGGGSIYGEVGTQPEIAKREYYNSQGERYDPFDANPILALKQEWEQDRRKYQPVADLYAKYFMYQQYRREAFHAARKANELRKDIENIKANADAWVREHAAEKEQEIIEERKRARVNIVDERTLLEEALFWIK
jgi:hypothetical protein